MVAKISKTEHTDTDNDEGHSDEDLGDMLQELRILLQGAQVLTAFLIVLPFNEGFAQINDLEKWIYMGTFLCSIASLVLFSAPAAHHRLVRPLMNRPRFKDFSTRMIIAGLVPASLALVGVTQLVTSTVIGDIASWIVSGGMAVGIGLLWWIIPLTRKNEL